MNANHVRPLLAFWLLALAAAVITVFGLRAGATEVSVPSGSPAPVTQSGSPSLVLGGLLRAEPSSSTASPRAGRWSSIAVIEHTPGHSAAPTTRAAGAAPKTIATTSATETSVRATTTAAPTGKAKPHDGSGSGTTTSTATATTTHGKGQGAGGGHGSVDPGKGH